MTFGSTTEYYGIWTDSKFNILKHIGTNDLDDIKMVFGIYGSENFNIINIPNLKRDFLENSPVIPNPEFNVG